MGLGPGTQGGGLAPRYMVGVGFIHPGTYPWLTGPGGPYLPCHTVKLNTMHLLTHVHTVYTPYTMLTDVRDGRYMPTYGRCTHGGGGPGVHTHQVPAPTLFYTLFDTNCS